MCFITFYERYVGGQPFGNHKPVNGNYLLLATKRTATAAIKLVYTRIVSDNFFQQQIIHSIRRMI